MKNAARFRCYFFHTRRHVDDFGIIRCRRERRSRAKCHRMPGIGRRRRHISGLIAIEDGAPKLPATMAFTARVAAAGAKVEPVAHIPPRVTSPRRRRRRQGMMVDCLRAAARFRAPRFPGRCDDNAHEIACWGEYTDFCARRSTQSANISLPRRFRQPRFQLHAEAPPMRARRRLARR